MARVHPFQTNFTAGELTPKLHGQVDFKKYNNGVEELKNMTVFPQGGCQRRSGSRFICEVKDSTKTTRLIPFEFNITQAYVLELGDQYIRFFKDGGQITEANKTITAITKANPAVITSNSHGYSNGDHVWINSVGGMTRLNGRRFVVAGVTTNTFQLQGENSTSYDSYTSGGTAAKVYEIATPYTESMLFDINFTQSADVMYIVQESLKPRKLSRTGHTSWTLTEVDFKKGPYLDTNTSSTTMTPSGTSGSVTITASSSTFVANDVGRLITVGDGHAKITAYSSGTSVTATTTENFANTNANATWALGAWCTDKGYPRTVSFFEQRLVFGGSSSYPQTIWASESGLYEEFDAGDASAADAFIYTIAANRVNVIRWLSPARDLIVGTVGGEFKVGRPTGEPLKPDNVQITQQTTFGGYTTDPIQIGNAVLFVQRQQRKIREFSYRFEDDAYLAPDMTLLAEHITDTGIVDVDYAQEPDSIYWAVRTDGTLIGMTYQRDEDVIAWHRHEFGGANKYTFNGASAVTAHTTDANKNGYITISSHGLSTGDKVIYSAGGGTKIPELTEGETYWVYRRDVNTLEFADTYQQALDRTIKQITAGSGASHSISLQAKVKSITSINLSQENRVWIIVERRINGNKVQYIEYLDSTISMDSCLTALVNDGTTTVTGLNHLEGETVQLLIGDAVYPTQTVSSGQITATLPTGAAYKTIEIGLGYTSTIKTLKIENGSQAGTAQARKKRYNEVVVRLLKSVGVTINGDQLPFRSNTTPVGQDIPDFTGDKRVMNLGWDREGQVTIEQTQPLPLTVLGITGTLMVID